MGNIGSSPTSCVCPMWRTGGGGYTDGCSHRLTRWVGGHTHTHRWVLPQTGKVGVGHTGGCTAYTDACTVNIRVCKTQTHTHHGLQVLHSGHTCLHSGRTGVMISLQCAP